MVESAENENNGTSEPWTIAKSMASLLACNGRPRTEDDSFSSDFLRPTITGVSADLASGIKAHHAKHVKDEGDLNG